MTKIQMVGVGLVEPFKKSEALKKALSANGKSEPPFVSDYTKCYDEMIATDGFQSNVVAVNGSDSGAYKSMKANKK